MQNHFLLGRGTLGLLIEDDSKVLGVPPCEPPGTIEKRNIYLLLFYIILFEKNNLNRRFEMSKIVDYLQLTSLFPLYRLLSR